MGSFPTTNASPYELVTWLRHIDDAAGDADPRRALAWKPEMSRGDQGLFEHFAGDALEMFGYERTGARRTFRGRLRSMYDAIAKRH